MFIPIFTENMAENHTQVDTEENSVGVNISDNTFNLDQPVQQSGNSDVSVANNPTAAIIVSNKDDSMTDTLIEWCVYNKYKYKIYTNLPQADQVLTYNTLLFGNIDFKGDNLIFLQEYAKKGITMIFTSLPSYDILENNTEMADFFGIKGCVSPSYKIDGIKIFDNFFLSQERIYAKNDDYGDLTDLNINIPYYTLREGYDAFAVAILNNQGTIKNEELPALLWRTMTSSSQIYVINCNIFYGQGLLGVITAFMSQANNCFLYPIVNAQTLTILDFPNFSNENAQTITDRYSMNTKLFCRNLLWPNIIKILNSYGKPYNYFVTPGLDYTNGDKLSDEDIMMYSKEMNASGGVMGLSLKQVSSATLQDVLSTNETFFSKGLPAYSFRAAYSGDFSEDELNTALESGQDNVLKNVKLVLSDFDDGKRIFRVMNNGALSVMTTMNGYSHNSTEDIRMISLETSLGMCIQAVNLDRAYYPKSDEDDWSKLSNIWSKGNTYFNDFKKFDDTSVYELEKRTRDFLAMNYNYARNGNTINISIANFNKEASFILRVHGEKVDKTTNCTAERLSDTAYLIKANAENATIELQNVNYLNLPKDNVDYIGG